MSPTAANFHSSGLRQKVDQLMDVLWAGGVNNPMDAIKRISYLLFLRLVSEQDDLIAGMDRKYKRAFSGDWAKYAWGNFVTLTGDALFDAVRPAVENIHKLPGLSATGQLLFQRATLTIYDRPTLRAVIQMVDTIALEADEGADLEGDMYEHLLSKLSASGTNGQFRTPRHGIAVPQVVPRPPGGRAGVIVPNGVLFGSTKAAKKVRELLLNGFDLQAVVGLPSGVFKPYSGVGTAALIFENGGPTQSVWFYDLTADGFSLDDKRTPIDANDIPDVLAKWPGREEGPNSYRVPIEKIRENDLSLAAGRYKPVKVETAKHDAPAKILAEIVAMEEQIANKAKRLLAEMER